MMNGAETLVRTLVEGGIEVCFANPGTSEMHFVAALDRVPGMRCVLCLFEGVATGAADGYARMVDKPAATLLHLGPGLANALANMHNAKRANAPMLNIVGDHATYHKAFDAPLNSDVEAVARPFSHWVFTAQTAAGVSSAGATAIAASRTCPGQVATLILPADIAWGEGGEIVDCPPEIPSPRVPDQRVDRVAEILLSGEPTLMLLGHRALREGELIKASKIANTVGAKFLSEPLNARTERGAGRVSISRIPNPIDQAIAVMDGFKHVILVGAKPPVAAFAYPNKPSELQSKDCQVHVLAERHEDVSDALSRVVQAVGGEGTSPTLVELRRPELPKGAITLAGIGATLSALMPDNAIICDESITTGRNFVRDTEQAPRHDWLQITGGSIGEGLPMAIGAAIACPDRKVIALQADGSGMYTVQSLWTHARENLNILTLVWANRSYQILRGELTNVGALNPGTKALGMLSLDDPAIDWVNLATSLGVPGRKAETLETLAEAMKEGLATSGPFLVEVVI